MTQDYSKPSRHSRSPKQPNQTKQPNHSKLLNQFKSLNQSIQSKLYKLLRSTNQNHRPRWRQHQDHLTAMKMLAMGEALSPLLRIPETLTEKERDSKDGGER